MCKCCNLQFQICICNCSFGEKLMPHVKTSVTLEVGSKIRNVAHGEQLSCNFPLVGGGYPTSILF